MIGGDETQVSLQQHIRALAAEVVALGEDGSEQLSDSLAHWLTAHYIGAARRAAANAGPGGLDLKALRGFIADVVALRRGDHSAERLSIDREQLNLNRELSNERREKLFWEWAMRPENKDVICNRKLSTEEKAARLREIFGMIPPQEQKPFQSGLSAEALQTIEKAAKLL